MGLQIACMNCHAALHVPEKLQGKTIRCPHCKEPTRVPEAPEIAPATDLIQSGSPPPPLPAQEHDRPADLPRPDDDHGAKRRDDDDRPRSKWHMDDEEVPRQRRRRDDDDDEEHDDDDEPRSRRDRNDDDDVPRPKRRKKRRGWPSARGVFVRLGIVALALAAGLGYFTYREGALAFRSSPEPEEISLKDLIARGPDGNPNLIITHYALCNNYVHEANADARDHWTHVWNPIVPIENADRPHRDRLPSPVNFKALLFSLNVRNERELGEKLDRPKLRVLVSPYTSLSSETRELLKKEYRATDFEKCIIIQEGRTPWDRNWICLMGGGAGVLLLAGVGSFVLAFLR